VQFSRQLCNAERQAFSTNRYGRDQTSYLRKIYLNYFLSIEMHGYENKQNGDSRLLKQQVTKWGLPNVDCDPALQINLRFD